MHQLPRAALPHPRTTAGTLLLPVAVALALRLLVVTLVFRDVASPSGHYEQFGWEMGWVARALALHHGFSAPFWPLTGPTALVPPLYPSLLAQVFRAFGLYTPASAFVILAFNSLCSALTAIPVYFAARSILNPASARVAAWIWALYPFSIYFSADRVWDYALTALLFATSFALALHLPQTRRLTAWMGFGALSGLAVLSNPSVAPALVALVLLAAIRSFRLYRQIARPTLAALLALTALGLVLTPWTLRNARALHILCPVRDGLWLELYAGNNGDTALDSNSPAAHPASNPVEMQRFLALGETAYLAEKRDLALHTLHDHPGDFAIATLRRTLSFWTSYWSFNRRYLAREPLAIPDILQTTAITAFMLLGLVSLWRTRRKQVLPGLLVLAIFPIPYYLTHTSPDYRQPIEPLIVLLVTAGLGQLNSHRRRTPTQAAQTNPSLSTA